MAALAALCKPHSASEQKLSTHIHSTLLDDFDICLIGCRLPPLDGYVGVCLVLTIEVYVGNRFVNVQPKQT